MNRSEDTRDGRTEPRAAARPCDDDVRDRRRGQATRSDPVCRMAIDAHSATYALEYAGRVFRFCSEGCLREFRRHPDEYARRGLE